VLEEQFIQAQKKWLKQSLPEYLFGYPPSDGNPPAAPAVPGQLEHFMLAALHQSVVGCLD
jgi:hypothetical protein